MEDSDYFRKKGIERPFLYPVEIFEDMITKDFGEFETYYKGDEVENSFGYFPLGYGFSEKFLNYYIHHGNNGDFKENEWQHRPEEPDYKISIYDDPDSCFYVEG